MNLINSFFLLKWLLLKPLSHMIVDLFLCGRFLLLLLLFLFLFLFVSPFIFVSRLSRYPDPTFHWSYTSHCFCWFYIYQDTARLILRVPKTDHIIPDLTSLHELQIDSRKQYKLASVCRNTSTLLLLPAWLNPWQFTNQPASYALLLTKFHSVFRLCVRTCLVRYIFFFCCTVCQEQSPLQS